jgi:hypothetical protein
MVPYPLKRFLLVIVYTFGVVLLASSRSQGKGNMFTADPGNLLAIFIFGFLVFFVIDYLYYQFKYKSTFKSVNSAIGKEQAAEVIKQHDGSADRFDYLIMTFLILLFPHIAPFYYLYRSKNYSPKKKKYARYISTFALVLAAFIILFLIFASMSIRK